MVKETDDNSKYVTITRDEYTRLHQAYMKLLALEAGGVGNWEWYEESLEEAGL